MGKSEMLADRPDSVLRFASTHESTCQTIGILEMRKVNGLSEFYSKVENDKIDMFIEVDERGYPTSSRPHVHVVFRERANEVDITATAVDGKHLGKETLRNPSGNDVRRAVQRAQQKLR
ncbi:MULTISPECIES: hypothetical protein [unclassified Gordonia (in: high G+C Gram-positive bacteria)]|uniref:hypothetical protein n=1 Tax=unclassified Gordonia (in: high G+C Gram-positive bacteria) TaxID=2657482 RepID=UPI001962B32E|nr:MULTISPECIES: hypothetical protein [unclassified Gordonia (in: high G+C Gram-positive bacteria)]MBN0974583.1 hypothetical protein [Gordonia sp. BP-119]MBN0984375.1 hypothetical protein [Gordonia sp. BP-94]